MKSQLNDFLLDLVMENITLKKKICVIIFNCIIICSADMHTSHLE